MANLEITHGGALLEKKELNFRNLYLYHTPAGPEPNQSTIVDANGATGLGTTVVNNWTIYDGPGPNATVVARAQGLHIYATNWHNSFTIVFEIERFKGSTLQVMGINVEEGEWAIVGGTGEFTMASGVIYKKKHEQRDNGNIIELTIHAFCPLLEGSRILLTKIGPWGKNGGTVVDITDAPKHLESITVLSGAVIDSIAFSYIDQADQKFTAGPWGGPGGNPNSPIQLASNEFVYEISGTFGTYLGKNAVTSLKFVTNMKTYGPYGRGQEDPPAPYVENEAPFTVPVQSNGNIVGFFGRGGKYLEAIGVYVQPFFRTTA